MAFWGAVLKPGLQVKVEDIGDKVLHLSQTSLYKQGDGRTFIEVQPGGQKRKYAIACLEDGKAECASFDLFFRAGQATFGVRGTSEIHLTGYIEPDALDAVEARNAYSMEDEVEGGMQVNYAGANSTPSNIVRLGGLPAYVELDMIDKMIKDAGFPVLRSKLFKNSGKMTVLVQVATKDEAARVIETFNGMW
jgi:hypothetical protein